MTKPVLNIVRDPDVRHAFLWAKTVRAVNLNVHCFNALVGGTLPVDQEAVEQTLLLPSAPAWYLCGVTEPEVWEHNSHVLLLPDPDTTEPRTVITPALYVTMWGVREVDITADDLDPEPYQHHPRYVTCRNLQAAWVLNKRHGFDHEGRRALVKRSRQAAAAGIPEPRI